MNFSNVFYIYDIAIEKMQTILIWRIYAKVLIETNFGDMSQTLGEFLDKSGSNSDNFGLNSSARANYDTTFAERVNRLI